LSQELENDSTFRQIESTLVDLKWSESEVTDITDMLSGVAYIKSNATESEFKKNASDANILHLATHALIDDEQPLYSKMIFANEKDSCEDGYLNTYELYNMELNADLVVLSACNTGYGKCVHGEGIMSLARGFLYAGCPSIVMSLWPVDDQYTSIVMKNFYQGLTDSLRKNEALRQAKLTLINNGDENSANPFYWAGFISIGNPNPIDLDVGKRNKKSYLFIIISVLFTIGIMTIIYIKHKQTTK
jgi:CHAT domain-containing protein